MLFRTSSAALLAALFSCVVAAPASAASDAARTINETRPLDAEGRVSVRNIAGCIDVQAWDQPTVAITGVLGESAEALVITGGSRDLQIEVKNRKGDLRVHNGITYSGGCADASDGAVSLNGTLSTDAGTQQVAIEGNARDGQVDASQGKGWLHAFWHADGTLLHIRVPMQASVSLDGTSADIHARGLKGPLVVHSVSGDVAVAVSSPSAEVESVSGDLDIDAPLAKSLKLSTVSGDTVVHSGIGALKAESVSGNVQVVGSLYGAINAQSVSGDIEISAATVPQAVVKIETMSGDVRFVAPANLDAEVSLESFSGDVASAFAGATATKDERNRRRLRVGNGQGSVRLSSFSGDVQLERRAP
jgi:Putative adhesin